MNNNNDPRWNYDDPRFYEGRPADQAPSRPAYDDLGHQGQIPTSPDPLPYDNVPPDGYDLRQHQEEERRLRIQRTIGKTLGILALVAIAFLGGWFSHEFFSGPRFDSNNQSKSYLGLIQEAWQLIDENYVDRENVNYKKMAYTAIDSMVTSLNDKQHTRFLTPDDVKNENQQLSGKVVGIGVYVQQDPNTKKVFISGTMPDSPAEKAGLKANDVIVAVDGKSTQGKDLSEISAMIKGKEGTDVTLTIQRPGEQGTKDFKITRASITVPNVLMYYIPDSHIAHIQIVQFTDGVTSQLKEAVNKAKAQGAQKIVLDLRNNPGGYLREAIDTASLFLEQGTILIERDKSGNQQEYKATGQTLDTKIPLVVLTNNNTASAAEIVASALRDNGRATIIGEKTLGTGTVLQQFDLSDGSAILLGIREWLTPKGQFIRDQGVQPDVTIKLAPNVSIVSPTEESSEHMNEAQIMGSQDKQLQEAIKYLKAH
ncbi:carboxyl-terminal processing protease [Thermosporothrix hazakensis]|uniref:Carboxyl-terminal processing protease n=2 Tax=Thermosporothrix TaxID=768650 RepID=A0A326UC04_THEHA|nr:S41 family peptidase [Thermosporothrix hazakensis]PZW35906.1 carboxyl-terminal processing protease [Thermosporothrix hazakensis]BBH88373.1 hypothetical protein KTC_31240 [Thermosporothrix sp. COM3]GCE46560.1 hypothetical protein KTH_14290 [Thermosporothrix hazakensis]